MTAGVSKISEVQHTTRLEGPRDPFFSLALLFCPTNFAAGVADAALSLYAADGGFKNSQKYAWLEGSYKQKLLSFFK